MHRLTKIRDDETVSVYDSSGHLVETIKRNLYSYYVANISPVYCRYLNRWYLVQGHFNLSIQLNDPNSSGYYVAKGSYIK